MTLTHNNYRHHRKKRLVFVLHPLCLLFISESVIHTLRLPPERISFNIFDCRRPNKMILSSSRIQEHVYGLILTMRLFTKTCFPQNSHLKSAEIIISINVEIIILVIYLSINVWYIRIKIKTVVSFHF